jgi:hypothetical protein
MAFEESVHFIVLVSIHTIFYEYLLHTYYVQRSIIKQGGITA